MQLRRKRGILPFESLGVVKDYNGVDIKQTSHYIGMSCENYIHRLARTHGWELDDNNNDTVAAAASVKILTPENDPQLLNKQDPSQVPLKSDPLFRYSPNRMVPIPSDSIERMYKETGPKEGVAAHKLLENKMGYGGGMRTGNF